MKKIYNQLPQVAFSILLALSLRERHGYEIIQQIAEDSNGRINVGPGALYTSIRQLLQQGLIVEIRRLEDNRRRYYTLSVPGGRQLASELEYYQRAIKLAEQRQILGT